MKYIIVLAGSRSEFDEWLSTMDPESRRYFIYFGHPETIGGIEASHVIMIGTWYERPDRYDRKAYAETRIK